MSDEPLNYYAKRLMREIEEIDRRMDELRQEKHALERQLINARWETHALRDANRKNSAVRVLVEERILGALREATNPLSNTDLFRIARMANRELKETTFRTYLFRLKEKGLIESPLRGRWKITNAKIGAKG